MEPLLPSTRYHDFYNDTVVNKNKNYVLKIQAGEIGNVPEEIQDILCYNHCTTIFLRRKDIIAQYTSNYIANIRNVFMYEQFSNVNVNTTVPLDLSKMLESILEIDYHLEKMKNLIYRRNIELIYEDLNLNEQTQYIKTLPCPNYDEIYTKIKTINNQKFTGWFNNLTIPLKHAAISSIVKSLPLVVAVNVAAGTAGSGVVTATGI